MPTLYWDLETRGVVNLTIAGSWRYAADAATEVLCACYAVDNGDVQIWLPDDPVPVAFIAAADDPANWQLVAHQYEFERAVLECILTRHHGFPPIALASQHCSQRLAMANAYPAELGLLSQALGLPYRKDPKAAEAMRTISRPRKPRRGEDRSIVHWNTDPGKYELVRERCKLDVITMRAVWQHPKLKHLNETERAVQILDAQINARGVRADRAFVTAARGMAVRERNAINTRLSDLTAGVITTVDQPQRFRAEINARGHQMTSMNKRAVAAVLAGKPDNYVRELLELRRAGARASVKKFDRILAYAGGDDDRLRGTLRMYGAGPGRWSGAGPQLQNLKKNEANLPLTVVDAVRNGDRARLAQFGNPLALLGDISRAALCAAPGHVLIVCDYGSIESRVLSWLSGEDWKTRAYETFDRTGDKRLEPYRVIAGQMLQKDVLDITPAERQIGKGAELAAGFGGSVGAWRRLLPGDARSDAEIKLDIERWRRTHPRTTQLWRDLARAIRIATRTGQAVYVGGGSRPTITASFEAGNLYLTLPSGRQITYPAARLVAGKFEDGPPDVAFKDNARKQWSDYRGWFGVFVENVVQGTARDLLAAALLRFEARGVPVVMHCHDDIVAEVPIGSITEEQFLAIMLEAPAWAAGLPLAGKVWSGPHYLEAPEQAATPKAAEDVLELAIDSFIDDARNENANVEEEADEDLEDESDDDTDAPLFELVDVPLTDDHKTSCPFHGSDTTPSLQIYADHFGCGEHGDRLDWLMRGEGMSREDAIAAIRDWDGTATQRPIEDKASKTAFALQLWSEARPIANTLAARYLDEHRRIDIAALPNTVEDVLRFHPACCFGPGTRHPCLLALMRDAVTDAVTGIQRVALTADAAKIDRRMLGHAGVVKLWSAAATTLVIGEGIETTLAAATRIPYRGEPLRPAWALLSAGALGRFPVIAGVERLIILVDHDTNGVGQADAARCTDRWIRAGRTVIRLTPKRPGADFNSIIMPENSHDLRQ